MQCPRTSLLSAVERMMTFQFHELLTPNLEILTQNPRCFGGKNNRRRASDIDREDLQLSKFMLLFNRFFIS